MESIEEKEESSIPLQVTNRHKTDPILVYRSASSALRRVKIRETPLNSGITCLKPALVSS